MTTDRTSPRPGHLVLVRFSGDISTKGPKTRQRFVRNLEENIADALRAEGIRYRLRREWQRLYVEADSPLALNILPRVFGIQSISPVERHPWHTMEDIVTTGERLFRDHVRGKRFAVRCRRGGNTRNIPFTSMDVDRELGTALLPHAAGVDLGHPEAVALLEVLPGEAFYFTRTIPGQGGLPLNIQGRALSLVSGGFDSAVASWMMLRRGVSLDYLFCNLGGDEHRAGALRVMKIVADLWSAGHRPALYEVDFLPVIEEIKTRTLPRFWQIVLKRRMFRAAELLARELDTSALVTGEAVGQVSSQTLQNLAVISRATDLVLLRPLVGANKDDIVETAREIGTYEASAAVPEYCDLAARHPATAATFEAVDDEEAKLDPELLPRLVSERHSHDLRALELESAGGTDVDLDEVPEGAALLDLRALSAFQAWHPPEALHLEYGQALKAYRSFPRDRTYVLYCEIGFKSAHLARAMQNDGYRAYHLRRGVRQLRRRAPVPTS